MTDTDTTAAFFIGGPLDGQRIHTAPGRMPCAYRDDHGEPVTPALGDDEFGFGRLGHRTPQRYYRRVLVGIGFEAGYVHCTVWPDWERASFGDHQAVLLHLRRLARPMAPQQLRRADRLASRDQHLRTDPRPGWRLAC